MVLEAWGGERAGTVFRLSSEAVRDGTVHERGCAGRRRDRGATRRRRHRDAAHGALHRSLVDSAGRCAAAKIAFGLRCPSRSLPWAMPGALPSSSASAGSSGCARTRSHGRGSLGAALTASLTFGRAGLVAALLILIWGELGSWPAALAWVGRDRGGGGGRPRPRRPWWACSEQRRPSRLALALRARGSALAAWSGSTRPRGSGEQSAARSAAHRRLDHSLGQRLGGRGPYVIIVLAALYAPSRRGADRSSSRGHAGSRSTCGALLGGACRYLGCCAGLSVAVGPGNELRAVDTRAPARLRCPPASSRRRSRFSQALGWTAAAVAAWWPPPARRSALLTWPTAGTGHPRCGRRRGDSVRGGSAGQPAACDTPVDRLIDRRLWGRGRVLLGATLGVLVLAVHGSLHPRV